MASANFNDSRLHNVYKPLNMSSSSRDGWVPERSNGLAWKACVPHKGTEGSNPSPSASPWGDGTCKE